MSEPVVCVRLKERVSYIIDILKNTTHNGFPVVDEVDEGNRSNGRLRGIILRSQLIVILKRSLFEETQNFWNSDVSMETFRNYYPRFPSIRDVHISENKDAKKYSINMEVFMNPTPYNIHENTSVPRIFQLFRALGLRHLIVVDSNNLVKGIVTRKDFLK
jgi:chloride channel 7